MSNSNDTAWLVAVSALIAGGALAATCRVLAKGNSESATARALRATHRVIAVLPVAVVACFVSLVLLARLALGFWPYPAGIDSTQPGLDGIYSSPLDPKTFPIPWAVVWYVGPIAYFSAYFMAGLLAGSLRSKLLARAAAWSVAHFASWALLLVIVFVDPGQFFDWYLD